MVSVGLNWAARSIFSSVGWDLSRCWPRDFFSFMLPLRTPVAPVIPIEKACAHKVFDNFFIARNQQKILLSSVNSTFTCYENIGLVAFISFASWSILYTIQCHGRCGIVSLNCLHEAKWPTRLIFVFFVVMPIRSRFQGRDRSIQLAGAWNWATH